ncbi:MAG TPA: NAD(+) kinase [Burkholderiales bacterium]|nr:NAD(+) kinase [Burkholderiales bacterium]
MSKTFRTVGIIGKLGDPSVAGRLAQLTQYLQSRKLKVLVEAATAESLDIPASAARPMETLGAEIDLAIVIGGDGTILRVARLLANHGVPTIGINLGRVGFLADISADEMIDEIGKILDGQGEIIPRMLLQAEVLRGGKRIHDALALNDVVVTKGELARLIEFETWLGGEFVSSVRGDGIIVSTPTGSTAYALSAGGPIIYPHLPAITLVPICPHTLSQRPLVVPSDSVVEIVMAGTAPGQKAHVTFDGQTTVALEDNDRVKVRRADVTVELLHPAGRSHFEVLRTKLHWGRKL